MTRTNIEETVTNLEHEIFAGFCFKTFFFLSFKSANIILLRSNN